MKLEKQVAIITGGGRGIGRATALSFAKEGAQVSVLARTRAEIDAVAAEVQALGCRALALTVDVADEAAVNAAIAQVVSTFGRIDILVNSAGILEFGRLSEAPVEMWDRIMGINLRGAYLITRAVLPIMRQQGSGNVVMVSAIGAFGGGGIAPIYRASKAALNSIGEAFALETLGQGIRVNTVCPAETDPRMAASAYPGPVDRSNWAKPEELADVILFLATGQSRAMTGATIIGAGPAKLSRWG